MRFYTIPIWVFPLLSAPTVHHVRVFRQGLEEIGATGEREDAIMAWMEHEELTQWMELKVHTAPVRAPMSVCVIKRRALFQGLDSEDMDMLREGRYKFPVGRRSCCARL